MPVLKDYYKKTWTNCFEIGSQKLAIYYACAMCDEGTVYYEGHSGFNRVFVNAFYSRYNVISGIYASCLSRFIGFSGSKG